MEGRRQQSAGLQQGWLDVGGVRQRFWLAQAPQPEAPLLLVLHGLGTKGKHMDRLTALARRGPAAGFATVFPDGWGQVWDGGRQLPRRTGIDDAGFMVGLVDRLVSDGAARAGALVLVGMSNGAFFGRVAESGVARLRG
jgi:polyhydroxybutyrate depolymerase